MHFFLILGVTSCVCTGGLLRKRFVVVKYEQSHSPPPEMDLVCLKVLKTIGVLRLDFVPDAGEKKSFQRDPKFPNSRGPGVDTNDLSIPVTTEVRSFHFEGLGGPNKSKREYHLQLYLCPKISADGEWVPVSTTTAMPVTTPLVTSGQPASSDQPVTSLPGTTEITEIDESTGITEIDESTGITEIDETTGITENNNSTVAAEGNEGGGSSIHIIAIVIACAVCGIMCIMLVLMLCCLEKKETPSVAPSASFWTPPELHGLGKKVQGGKGKNQRPADPLWERMKKRLPAESPADNAANKNPDAKTPRRLPGGNLVATNAANQNAEALPPRRRLPGGNPVPANAGNQNAEVFPHRRRLPGGGPVSPRRKLPEKSPVAADMRRHKLAHPYCRRIAQEPPRKTQPLAQPVYQQQNPVQVYQEPADQRRPVQPGTPDINVKGKGRNAMLRKCKIGPDKVQLVPVTKGKGKGSNPNPQKGKAIDDESKKGNTQGNVARPTETRESRQDDSFVDITESERETKYHKTVGVEETKLQRTSGAKESDPRKTENAKESDRNHSKTKEPKHEVTIAKESKHVAFAKESKNIISVAKESKSEKESQN